MQKELQVIRKKIDRLDSSLVQLLKKRSSLIKNAAELKKDIYPKIRFARETLMAHHLTKKDFGYYDNRFMQRIWRELISASLNIEGELVIEVLGNDTENIPLWTITRDHFGSYSDISRNPSLDSIFENLVNDRTTIAVIPFPHEEINWWDYVAKHPKIQVHLTLPFLPNPPNIPYQNGVVLSKALLEKSEEDSSLFLVTSTTFKPYPNVKVVLQRGNQYLILVNGFCTDLELISKFVKVSVEEIIPLGSYPKPITPIDIDTKV